MTKKEYEFAKEMMNNLSLDKRSREWYTQKVRDYEKGVKD
jgi:hypothetical protein